MLGLGLESMLGLTFGLALALALGLGSGFRHQHARDAGLTTKNGYISHTKNMTTIIIELLPTSGSTVDVALSTHTPHMMRAIVHTSITLPVRRSLVGVMRRYGGGVMVVCWWEEEEIGIALTHVSVVVAVAPQIRFAGT